MVNLNRSRIAESRSRQGDAVEFRLIYMATFVVFLVAGIIARFLPPRWRPYLAGPGGYRSVLGEARAAASTCAPYAFMG